MVMHKNHIWLAFLSAIALIVLFFSVSTAYEMYQHLSMTANTPALQTHWSVVQKASDRYVLHVSYTYQVKARVYEGSMDIPGTNFKNAAAAETMMPTFSAKERIVWFAPHHSERSTIQKSFPLKSSIYMAIIWGVLLYFIWLGFYAGKFTID